MVETLKPVFGSYLRTLMGHIKYLRKQHQHSSYCKCYNVIILNLMMEVIDDGVFIKTVNLHQMQQ